MHLYSVHEHSDLHYDGYTVLTCAIGHDPADHNGQ
jgi:hypothetical protein